MSVCVQEKRLCTRVRIVDESDDWIVVEKPPFLQVHPSKPDGSFTLWEAARQFLAFEIANGGQVSIINRLDRDTSGLTLICKHAAAAREFSQLMMRRAIHKEYLAIVCGWPSWAEYTINVPLRRQGEFAASPVWLKQATHEAGAPALTTIRVVRRFIGRDGAEFSVVRAIPHTGRMHQIRVHLASVGHPIVGDKIYGPSEDCYIELIETGWTPALASRLLLDRHALHSAVLRVDSLGLAWQSDLPADLSAFVYVSDGGR
jgi:23S rRNA pseudouridine1911/1915/1917 synthase